MTQIVVKNKQKKYNVLVLHVAVWPMLPQILKV